MELAEFKIVAGPLGGSIVVNGEDVTDRVGVAELRVADGQPTVLTLHQAGDGTIEGQGIVQVVTGDDRSDADIICSFLESINPDELDSDALNDADASTNLTAALLATLMRYVRGQ